MKTLYVPLEEVFQILKWECGDLEDTTLIHKINSLETIDPIEEIDKMQEELKKSHDYMNDKLAGPVREKLLEELKERLSPKN